MATLAWNIKLLGNLTERDFLAWKTAAKIPSVYNFNVSVQDKGREQSYWEDEHQPTTVIVPGEDNTIVVVGREGGTDFEPLCFAGNRCTMFAQKDDFTTGTELLALMLTCDGLLDRGVLNKVMDNVDLGEWIKKNQPDALDAYNHRDTLIGADGYIDESNAEGEKLKNAMCQYVVKVLGLGKTPTTGTGATGTGTTGTGTMTSTQRTPIMMYVLAGGAVAVTLLGYYIYQKVQTQ
jgi:hypothetical protein